MAVSRRGDHAVEHRALDGQRARERAAPPRAAQGEQQGPLGPRQLDGRPPVGRRRGIVGQQPRPLPPPLPRRARGATGPRPRLPATQAARARVRGVGAVQGRRSLRARRAVGEGSAVRRGARVPSRLSTRRPAGPPAARPPRRRRSRAWAARTPSRAAASTRAPAPDARPAARGRRSIWSGCGFGYGLGLGVG